jgi:hypothetical protein
MITVQLKRWRMTFLLLVCLPIHRLLRAYSFAAQNDFKCVQNINVRLPQCTSSHFHTQGGESNSGVHHGEVCMQIKQFCFSGGLLPHSSINQTIKNKHFSVIARRQQSSKFFYPQHAVLIAQLSCLAVQPTGYMLYAAYSIFAYICIS